MNKIAVLVFKNGKIVVEKGVLYYEIEVRYENGSQHKYITLSGFEDVYNYMHTFFEPIITFMFFDNENDLVYDDNGLCIGYKTIKYIF
jgi:hypothetical protein